MRSPASGLRPVVSVSKTISRMRRLMNRPARARQARMRRTARRVSSIGPPVGMTKSARARFSASGICRARICSNFSAVMPGRASTRARWTSAGAETTAILSTCRQPPSSNSSGMSSRTSGAARCAARKACALARHRRMDQGLEPAQRLGVAEHGLGQRWRDRRRRRRSCPGNALRSRRPARPSGPCRRCTTASASNTGTPSSANICATVDLPMPIEPVRPRMIIGSAARAAPVSSPAGRSAEETARTPAPPADQHSQPIDRSGRGRARR